MPAGNIDDGGEELEVELVDYGVDHSQYFQGHGHLYPGCRYSHSALGVGDNFDEALNDAIDQACSYSYEGECPDYEVMRDALRSQHPYAVDADTEHGWVAGKSAHEDCDVICYCGKILSEVKDAEGDGVHWEAGCDDSLLCEDGSEHEPDDSNHENCELHYHVGLRW